MGEKIITGREAYQKNFLAFLQKAKTLPEGIGLLQAIEALVDAKRHRDAARLLFGCGKIRLDDDKVGHLIFMSLAAGRQPWLIKELARNHRWLADRPGKGLVIAVSQGEFFSVMEPLASKVTMAVYTG